MVGQGKVLRATSVEGGKTARFSVPKKKRLNVFSKKNKRFSVFSDTGDMIVSDADIADLFADYLQDKFSSTPGGNPNAQLDITTESPTIDIQSISKEDWKNRLQRVRALFRAPLFFLFNYTRLLFT
jgi:hypothetical protein